MQINDLETIKNFLEEKRGELKDSKWYVIFNDINEFILSYRFYLGAKIEAGDEQKKEDGDLSVLDFALRNKYRRKFLQVSFIEGLYFFMERVIKKGNLDPKTKSQGWTGFFCLYRETLHEINPGSLSTHQDRVKKVAIIKGSTSDQALIEICNKVILQSNYNLSEDYLYFILPFLNELFSKVNK
jgi:hypothetical protein